MGELLLFNFGDDEIKQDHVDKTFIEHNKLSEGNPYHINDSDRQGRSRRITLQELLNETSTQEFNASDSFRFISRPSKLQGSVSQDSQKQGSDFGMDEGTKFFLERMDKDSREREERLERQIREREERAEKNNKELEDRLAKMYTDSIALIEERSQNHEKLINEKLDNISSTLTEKLNNVDLKISNINDKVDEINTKTRFWVNLIVPAAVAVLVGVLTVWLTK